MNNSRNSSETLLALQSSSRRRHLDEQRQKTLGRDCVVLVSAFLSQNGYCQTASQFNNEAKSVLSRWSCADNIDLRQVVSEFEEYFSLKHGKKPKFSRLRETNESSSSSSLSLSKKNRNDSMNGRPPTCTSPIFRRQKGRASRTEPHKLLPERSTKSKNDESNIVSNVDNTSNFVKGTAICVEEQERKKEQIQVHSDEQQQNGQRILKPHPSFDDHELQSLASSLQGDILDVSPNVKWSDIVGLEDSKRLLKEAIVFPLQHPSLFQGLLKPWKGVLLFGLPGTGKTLLAKASATESDTTFFNISASSIVSKFRGDSEKLIKVLFNLARHHAPSTIFFDEIDSILSHRVSAGEGIEHEGSRRMKTQLLVEMDGISEGSDHVFILAATNLPWDLDPSLLRRLDKRIHVPTPDLKARKEMIQKHLSNHINDFKETEFHACAASTTNFSGADIKLICKETAMAPVRKILLRLEEIDDSSTSNPSASVAQTNNTKRLLEQNPISLDDFQKSLARTKSSLGENDMQKYIKWANCYGST